MTEPSPRNRLRVEVRQTRNPLRRQRWYVRLVWTANGNIAMHSETYRDKQDAIHLADELFKHSLHARTDYK